MDYANPSKLTRAQKFAKEQGKEGDESVIKAQYIALGGKVINEEETEEQPVEVKKGRKIKEETE